MGRLSDLLVAHLNRQFVEIARLHHNHDVLLVVCEGADLQLAILAPNEPSGMAELCPTDLIHHVAEEALIDTLTHAQLLVQAALLLLCRRALGLKGVDLIHRHIIALLGLGGTFLRIKLIHGPSLVFLLAKAKLPNIDLLVEAYHCKIVGIFAELQLGQRALLETSAQNPKLLSIHCIKDLDSFTFLACRRQISPIVVQRQQRNGFRVTSDLFLIPLTIEHLNEGCLRAGLRKDSQYESISRAIQCADTRRVIDRLESSEEVKVGEVVHMERAAHDDNNLIFAKLDGEDWTLDIYGLYFAQLVLVPYCHFIWLLTAHQGHNLRIKEQLRDLEILEALSFKFTLEGVRHEHFKAIASPNGYTATILIEAKRSYILSIISAI